MRIAINTLSVVPNEVGGTETYLSNLLENIIKIDRQNIFYLIVSKNNKSLFNYNSKNVHYIDCTFDNISRIKRILWEQMILPVQLKMANIDILISPGNTGLFFPPSKTITIIQSMHYYIYPEIFPIVKRKYLQYIVKYSCNRADIVISVSINNKKDIIQYTKISPDKIKIIYEGVNYLKFFKPINPVKLKNILEKYKINTQYIFAPISLYKYKNYNTTIKAYKKFKENINSNIKLVISGVDPHQNKADMQKLIIELNLEDDVYYLGYIPHEEIRYFFKGADLTIYFSSYESFGLPVLEAMASGSPVICSNQSSLPEVVGDAGILVDPHDIDEMANAIYMVLTNNNLKQELIEKGLDRAKQFSWKKTAEETYNIYESAFNSGKNQ